LDSSTLLDAICARLRPESAPTIRARIETALVRQFGDSPDPDAVTRFLEDIRLAQVMSGIDMDYAEHYTQMHKAGVDFMALAQAVKAADKDCR
jgi:hypothetical protein